MNKIKIEISPLINTSPKYEISYSKFKTMLEIKKGAQRYDSNGQKKFVMRDGVGRPLKQNKKAPLLHDKMQGPFMVAIFLTEPDLESTDAPYIYQGSILFESNEYAYVYRDSLMDGYKDAYFCDDSNLLIDVRDKVSKTKRAIMIEGEPTWTECWDFTTNDDSNGSKKAAIETQLETLAKSNNLTKDKVFGIIALNDG